MQAERLGDVARARAQIQKDHFAPGLFDDGYRQIDRRQNQCFTRQPGSECQQLRLFGALLKRMKRYGEATRERAR